MHHLENEAPTRLGGLRVRGRVVRAGACRQAREEGGLRERQVARVLVEVDARGHLDPVGAVPEVDGVQVGGEDPVLRPLALELPCEGRLLQLAADRALLLRVRVLDELLRDRRAALDDRLVPDVGPDGAQNASVVDPLVLPEAPVLDRHDRLFHDRGDVLARDDDPALVAPQGGEHGLTVRRVDVAELLRPFARRRLERRDVARDRAHEPIGEGDDRDEQEDAEQRKKSELADPAALGRATASSERHEVGDSSPVARPQTR